MENNSLNDYPKIMCFNSDDEFSNFAINPNLIMKDGYFDYDLTQDYYKAIDDGIEFIIRDPESLITKRNCITYHTISKNIKNLHKYYYEDELKYIYPDFKPINMICDDNSNDL